MLNVKLVIILSMMNSAFTVRHLGDLSEIVNIGYENLAEELEISFERSRELFEEIDANITTLLSAEAAGIIPIVGPAISAATRVIELEDSECRLRPRFIRPGMEARIHDVQAEMRSLNTIFDIVMSNLTEPTTKRNNLDIAENRLNVLVNKFSDIPSPYEASKALPSLFRIAAFLPPFEALKYQWKKDLVKVSNVSCKFVDILSQYRAFVVSDRVRWLDVNPSTEELWNECKERILKLEYDPAGYVHVENLTCVKPSPPPSFLSLSGHAYIWDRFNAASESSYYYELPIASVREVPTELVDDDYGVMGTSGETIMEFNNQTLQCIEGILGSLRERVEKAFDGPLTVVNKVCATSKKVRAGFLTSSN